MRPVQKHLPTRNERFLFSPPTYDGEVDPRGPGLRGAEIHPAAVQAVVGFGDVVDLKSGGKGKENKHDSYQSMYMYGMRKQ